MLEVSDEEASFLAKLYIWSAGGLFQALAFPMNLGRFGNSIALFLGVEPADVFLYVFLPPLLFDASVRIYYFVFKKVWQPIYILPHLAISGPAVVSGLHLAIWNTLQKASDIS